MSKPRVIIFGGLGFIGRNLVKFLVENDLCSFIRVVDKAMPATSNLHPIHQAAFQAEVVNFVQADLSRDAGVEKAFTTADGQKFDFAINLAAESKYGQEAEVYAKNILSVAEKVGQKSKEQEVAKFIEVSHAGIYEPKLPASDESGKIGPWTTQSDFKHQAENALQAMGLPLVILRPAIVYGVGDQFGLTPRLTCARVYQQTGDKMKFLWGADLRLNTVHVADVARAIWHACSELPAGSVFNLADKSDTSQGSLNHILEEIFGIKTGFQGTTISKIASKAMKMTAEHINDKHMDPWGELCQGAGIQNTPLTPYLDVELLYNKHVAVDGTAIEATGFQYEVPTITVETLGEQHKAFLEQNLFPQ